MAKDVVRLITFQDLSILNTLKYHNTFESSQDPSYIEEDLINKFTLKMKESLGIDKEREFYPLWAWVPKKDELFDDNTLEKFISLSTPKANNLCALELLVPKEFVFISNFDLWDSYRFKIRFESEGIITDEEIDKLFEKCKGARLQASLPFITKEWVSQSKKYYDPMKFDYSQTDNFIKEKIKSGQMQLDANGDIASIDK